jgi:hypothetical protein
MHRLAWADADHDGDACKPARGADSLEHGRRRRSASGTAAKRPVDVRTRPVLTLARVRSEIMATDVAAALITALGALIVALLTWKGQRQNDAAVATLRSDLEERSAERAARRDYEYEARKRLYAEVAPLLFQLGESADAARGQIRGICDPSFWPRLALSRQSRDVLTEKGWIGSTAYDITYAAYALLTPLASYRIIQRRLTVIDLSLDSTVHAQWVLLAALYESFWRDEDIARLPPALTYDPRVDDWRTLRQTNPARHWWQGVTRGRLDNAIDLIVEVEDHGHGPVRVSTFGEFETMFREVALTGEEREKSLGAFANALFDFHPDTRPVFWRLLAIQAVLYGALHRLETVRGRELSHADVLRHLQFSEPLRRQFDVSGAEHVSDLASVVERYLASYVVPGLKDLEWGERGNSGVAHEAQAQRRR